MCILIYLYVLFLTYIHLQICPPCKGGGKKKDGSFYCKKPCLKSRQVCAYHANLQKRNAKKNSEKRRFQSKMSKRKKRKVSNTVVSYLIRYSKIHIVLFHPFIIQMEKELQQACCELIDQIESSQRISSIRRIRIRHEYLKHIENGSKKIDGRQNKFSYPNFKVGDVINFYDDRGGECRKVIKRISFYKTVDLMLIHEGIRNCLPDIPSDCDLQKGVDKYNGLGDFSNGILAFEIN